MIREKIWYTQSRSTADFNWVLPSSIVCSFFFNFINPQELNLKKKTRSKSCWVQTRIRSASMYNFECHVCKDMRARNMCIYHTHVYVLYICIYVCLYVWCVCIFDGARLRTMMFLLFIIILRDCISKIENNCLHDRYKISFLRQLYDIYLCVCVWLCVLIFPCFRLFFFVIINWLNFTR